MADSQQNDDSQEQQKQEQSNQKESARSPRRQQQWTVQNPKPPRHNKLYRAPPTPDSDATFEREKTFVLDAIAVSSISEDYSRANPKLGSALPVYNSQKDQHVKPYFAFSGVDKTLQKNKQAPPGTSIEGPTYDRFYTTGHGNRYLTPRNEKQPCGYSNEQRMGHGKLWRHPNPDLAKYDTQPAEFQGYSGRFGYRRTTPRLRKEPSTFGVNTKTPIY